MNFRWQINGVGANEHTQLSISYQNAINHFPLKTVHNSILYTRDLSKVKIRFAILTRLSIFCH